MINFVRIFNFQSHGESRLDFHPRTNVIVGSSDSGKSAIIRAIKWAVWNRPSGDAIRSTWGGETSCEMVVDGNVITRHKDKVDSYKVQAKGKDIQEFKAIGTSVPEEINRLLNINEINLQQQLEQPFLLSESPGVVAQFFNKVAKLDKIDLGISNINSAIRSIEQDIKYKTAEVVKQEEQLKSFEYLEDMEKDVRSLEKLSDVLDITIAERAELKHLRDGIDNTIAGIEYYSDILALETQVDILIWQDGQRQDIQWNVEKLKEDIFAIKENEQKLKQQNKLLKLRR